MNIWRYIFTVFMFGCLPGLDLGDIILLSSVFSRVTLHHTFILYREGVYREGARTY